MTQIFPLYVLGPTNYYNALIQAPNPIIDLGEHFVKQSFRNRYEIAGPNGIERLIIPLEKGKNQKMAIKDVRISYAENWVNQHKRSLQTAYGNTPFYEYYGPEINQIFDKKHTYLIDLSTELLEWTLIELGFPEKIKNLSTIYVELSERKVDYRGEIQPIEKFTFQHIHQKRYELERDLSIIDILFHEARATRLRFL